MKFLNHLLLLLLASALFFSGCEKESLEPATQADPSPEALGITPQIQTCAINSFAPGIYYIQGDTVRNTLTIDGESREYLIYTPQNYSAWFNAQTEYSVVFMLHGRGQAAQRMVSHTGWKTLADQENIIVIYPQAWTYSNGNGGSTALWTTQNIIDNLPASETPRDDIKFIKEIRQSLLRHMRTKCDEFYACGFSNGGGFVKNNIRVELDHYFAATTSTGGIGMPFVQSPSHGNQRPHYETIGTNDVTALEKYYEPNPVNMPTDCSNWPSEPFWPAVENMAQSMGLNSNSSTCFTNPSYNLSFRLFGSFWAPGLAYRVRAIPNLGHRYPGPMTVQDFTQSYWDFMKGYTL